MQNVSTIVSYLNSEKVVLASGFMIGFMYGFKFNKKTLENPLSTIFNSAVSGFFCYIGAGLVEGFLPRPFKLIIPATAVASISYYKYQDYKKIN